MDGFHRTGAELAARGQLGIKGAPETFDADAFVDLVRRLRRGTDTVECPVFDRTIDEPVAGGVIVLPDDPVVIIEGNYLLLDRAPWAELRDLLDDVAHLETPTADRIRRLVDRHVEFGRDRSDAVQFVHRSDEANTRLIERCRARADLLVSFPPPSAP